MATEAPILSAVGADRFQLLRRLGEGGMGVVYEALDRQNQTRVALKMLKEADASAIYRIKWEFRALSQLFHRNLVQLYELHSDQEERWFFTMELVEDSLDFISHLREGRLSNICRNATTIVSQNKPARGSSSVLPDEAPPSTAALSARMPNEITGRIVGRTERIECPIKDFDALRALLVQLCEGVNELHRNHRLHRDLKPGNALVTRDGRVVLLDFGLVKELDSAPERLQGSMKSLGDTSYGSVIGTAGYMAPEQAAGLHLTPASDWYAVGAMLFEALTGRLPFVGTAAAVLRDKQLVDAPMPSELASGMPEELEALCLALLRRQPGERPRAEEILALLNAKPERRGPQSRPFVGRKAQLTSLGGALAAARDGATVICHLQGASGAGKSTLVERFHKQAKAEGALVLAGRCYENELVPYKAVDALVDALTSYLLSLSSNRIAKALPPGMASLARMFPVLQRISAVAKLVSEAGEARDPKDARQEACAALRALLIKMSSRQAVVLSIDDLQWGDVESAALLSNLLAGEAPPPVLVLFAYRSEYLQRSECLNALAALPMSPSQRVIRHELAVGAFDASESKQLALALLDQSVSDPERHAERIAVEAQGSAMFIGELVQQTIIAPSAPSASSAQPAATEAPTARSALDKLLWERVRQLPEPARSLIELTAVAGHPLRLGVLQAASSLAALPLHSLSELRSVRLIRMEGLRPDDALETFHDRVRESVVAHLEPTQRSVRHRQLAHALEAAGGAEPELLADHFLHAGEPAKASTYLSLAGEQAVHLFAFERAERLLRRGLELAEGQAARAECAERLIHFLTNSARFTEAYQQAIAAVAELGFGLPKRFLPPAFLLEWGRLELRLRGRSMQDLLELPLASDARIGLAVRLMNAVAKAAYQIRPELCVAVAVRIVNLCLAHGNTRECAIGYMVFGAIFKGGVLGKYARGYDFGRLALDLVERHGNAAQRAEVAFVVGYFGTSWRRPAIQAEALWRSAYDAGVEHRDLFHTGCAAAATTMSMFMRGVPFDDIQSRIHSYRSVLEPAGLSEPLGVMTAVTQVMRNLRGQSANPVTLDDGAFAEAPFLAQVAKYGSRHFAHCIHILRMQLHYLWERHEQALAEAQVAETFAKDSAGMLHGSEHVFYRGLIACALARRGAAKASSFLRKAKQAQRQLARWADHCPENFLLRAQLLAAELARCAGRHAAATDLYAAVLLGAETSSQQHLRGLAALLAAAHYADQSKWPEAATLRARAAEAFAGWGATALAEDIRSRTRRRSTEHQAN